MRKMLIAAAIGGILILPACAYEGGGAYYGAEVGAPDVYYDSFYGPYTDGYWGPDDFFYYRGGDGRFLRDESHHFQHRMFSGARGFHAHARPAGAGAGDRR
jgi:hypothetical protein